MNIENNRDYKIKVNIYTQDPLDKVKAFISDQAKKLLEEQKLIEKDNKDDEIDIFKDMLRSVKESSDPKNNPYDSMIKCIQIATRIINGDKVPGKDEQFLMEKEPKMYSTAIMLRQHKENPKKHKSLLEDENKKDITLTDTNKIDSVSIENLSTETEPNE